MKKTTKTAPLSDDTHKYLKRLQSILYDRYDINLQMKELIAYIINDENIGDAENLAKKIAEKEKSNNIFMEGAETKVLKLI